MNYQLIARLLLEKLWLWYSVWTEDCDKWSHLEGFMMIVINVAQRHYSSYIKSPITHLSPVILDCCAGVSRCCPRRCPLHMPWCTEGRFFCLSFRACLEPVGRPLWREGKDGGGTEKRGRENKRIKEETKEGRKGKLRIKRKQEMWWEKGKRYK